MNNKELENMKPVLVQSEFPVFTFAFLIILLATYLQLETKFNKGAIHKEVKARLVEVEIFDKELLNEFPNVSKEQLSKITRIHDFNLPVDIYAGNICFYECEAVRDIQKEINELVKFGDTPKSFLINLSNSRASDIEDQFLIHGDYTVRIKRLSRYLQDERRKILWKYKDLHQRISSMGTMDKYFLMWSLDLAYINVDESIVTLMAEVVSHFGKMNESLSVEDLRFVIRGRGILVKEEVASR